MKNPNLELNRQLLEAIYSQDMPKLKKNLSQVESLGITKIIQEVILEVNYTNLVYLLQEYVCKERYLKAV